MHLYQLLGDTDDTAGPRDHTVSNEAIRHSRFYVFTVSEMKATGGAWLENDVI